MSNLLNTRLSMKYFEDGGWYHSQYNYVYIDMHSFSKKIKRIPVVYYEEVMHQSMMKFSWLNYHFAYVAFETYRLMMLLLDKAKNKGIKLELPLNDYQYKSHPMWIKKIVDRINYLYTVAEYYNKKLDVPIHAFFIDALYKMNEEWITEEIKIDKDKFPDIRFLFESVSRSKLPDIKKELTQYLKKNYPLHPGLKKGYTEFKKIGDTVEEKHFFPFIDYIFNPMFPRFKHKEYLKFHFEDPKYNIDKRMFLVSQMIQEYYHSEDDYTLVTKKIEKVVGDKFSNPRKRRKMILNSISNKASKLQNSDTNHTSFSPMDLEYYFRLLVVFPNHPFEKEMEELLIREGVWTLLIRPSAKVILRGMDGKTYSSFSPIAGSDTHLANLSAFVLIHNYLLELLKSPDKPICLGKKYPGLFNCDVECSICPIEQINRILVES